MGGRIAQDCISGRSSVEKVAEACRHGPSALIALSKWKSRTERGPEGIGGMRMSTRATRTGLGLDEAVLRLTRQDGTIAEDDRFTEEDRERALMRVSSSVGFFSVAFS